MATNEAKTVYRQQGSTAEWTNAQVRQHGVSQFTVQWLAPVVAAHNFLRWRAMVSEAMPSQGNETTTRLQAP